MQKLTEKSMAPFFGKIIPVILLGFFALLIVVVIWPRVDLTISGLFYVPGKRFPLDYNPLFQAVHWIATYGAWGLAAVFLIAALATTLRKRSFFKLPPKSWLFLFLALVIGPGLVANIILKDHWGRARPAQIIEFGGTRAFSPALIPQPIAYKNGSFVAGDAAFGFFFPAIAYVVPWPRSRKFFWSGMGIGGLFGLARIMMGAHFLSDVLFAALVVLASTAALHAIMFGRAETRRCWREWFFIN